LTAAYDGYLRAFDLSKTVVLSAPIHNAPITSFSILPSETTADMDGNSTYTVVTSSQDLTSNISQVTIPTVGSSSSSKVLASLHLHTAPVSSISADAKGKQLLTSSWDGLIGLWDTTIPSSDEVPELETTGGERKKRRKVQKDEGKPKRKAPVNVLKSHVGRVSKVTWTSSSTALSSGFDATVRTWDVENGVCTRTIVCHLLSFHLY
jgi:ribosome biogenesis protein YTM1